MKRLFISSMTFVLVVFFSILGTVTIDSQINPIIYQLDLALDAYDEENTTQTKEYLNLSLEEWKNINKLLTITLRHDELDDIELKFVKLDAILLNNNTIYSFEIECQELIFQLNHIIEKEKFNIKNIF